MSYVPTSVSSDSVISDALEIASGGTSDIANVLDDIKLDSNLGANAVDITGELYEWVVGVDVVDLPVADLEGAEQYILQNPTLYVTGSDHPPVKEVNGRFYAQPILTAGNTPWDYGVVLTNDLNISEASGAMVIDDLMQKISTKVQVAAQMLSASNNIAKTASRILSQG